MGSEVEIDLQNVYNLSEYDYSISEIEVLDSKDLEYDNFFANFFIKNLPCVIKNISHSWQCSMNWVNGNVINYPYFIREYGEMSAPIANCDKIDFNSHCKCDMKVKDYMSYLEYEPREKLLYLKDWHLKRHTSINFYEVPHIFASDWLNEFAIDHEDDDFMFVYIGPQNTWTPFHADVYSSYSWSVNIVGKKKWILLPPGEEEKLKDNLGNFPLLLTPDTLQKIRHFEVIQEKGDGIFVPSGWHHQVVNLFDTISINHNFINGSNIELVWKALQKNLVAVEHEIQEFKDSPEFISQCQLILKSVFGMDFDFFINFIYHIGNKRLKQINGDKTLIFKTYSYGKNHITFDLSIILKIINLLQNHYLVQDKHLSQHIVAKLTDIKNSIVKVIKK